MDTNQILKADERKAILLRGNTWAYNFIVFAILIDIMYRALVFNEAAWDLFALLFASGVVSMVYAVRHKVHVFGRESAIVMALGAVIAAAVAAILAITKTM